jgi:hypothetical protein
MTTVREIIERHPRPVSLERDVLLRCIDACFCRRCEQACRDLLASIG